MTNEELIKEITSLPEEAKRQIERIIKLFKSGQPSAVDRKKRIPLREEPFFGMWKDREDMKEGGAAWVRKLRREQWDRSHKWKE
jgi:hypothetical protein